MYLFKMFNSICVCVCIVMHFQVHLSTEAQSDLKLNQTNTIDDLDSEFSEEPYIVNSEILNKIFGFDRKVIDRSLTLKLFNKVHKTKAQTLLRSSDSPQLDGFNYSNPTIYLIHGWLSEYSSNGWLDDYKDTIMKQMDDNVNVFVIDWSPLSKNINYLIPASSVRMIGHSLAEMVIELQIDSRLITCIGHSLGAHVCGGFGEKMFENNQTISKIWGLDPARPGFTKEGFQFRLSKSHAKFVEIVHTDSGKLGLSLHPQIGHFDYYLNGGEHQPGCPYAPLPYQLTHVSCNHQRATEFLIAQKQTTCQPLAYQCDSYGKFVNGECAECGTDNRYCRLLSTFNGEAITQDQITQDPIAHYRSESESQYYLQTSEEKPFCVFHYQVSFVTSADASISEGSVYIQLIGNLRDSDTMQVTRNLGSNFQPKTKYSVLYTSRKHLGRIHSARLTFHPNAFSQLLYIFLRRPFKVKYITVRFMSHTDERIRKLYSADLCDTTRTAQIGLTDNEHSAQISNIFSVC